MAVNGRNGIQTEVIESAVVALGNNEHESGVINVPANSILKKGTVLKRSGEAFAPLTDIEKETPVAVNPFDIENKGSAAANMALRAIISGKVRADLLLIDGAATTAAQNDLIRDKTTIVPIKVNDISHTE
jgi:hypothetical protein